MNDFDEERARFRETGSIAHRVIGNVAATTLDPTLTDVKVAVDAELSRFAPIEARAHHQNLRGLVHQYFWHCLPPSEFMLSAAEKQIESGRVDLVWFDITDRLLVDELKVGNPRSLQLSETANQVGRYLRACRGIWGDRFLGVRLISLSEPATSLFFDPDGHPSALGASNYIRKL